MKRTLCTNLDRFFKPKILHDIGTFQDGGLLHNNPLNIALWEVKHMWSDRSLPDFVLSIGTGVSDALLSTFAAGPHSPVKEGFLTRIFKTFMRSMDGEKIWKDIYNSLPESSKSRFHRLNLTLQGAEPAIDDISSMYELQKQAVEQAQPVAFLRPALDAIYASMFYFEFEEPPVFRGDAYACIGNIYCRVRQSEAGRKKFYAKLAATSSYFLICGQPVACIERVTKCAPAFKRRLTFTLDSLDDCVRITLRGITSQSLAISGLPRRAGDIMKAQGLDAPFGRADHSCPEKPLPLLPAKRKFGG